MSNDIPKGLVFSNTSPKRRKRSLLLAFVLLLVQCSLIWPVYPLFSSPTPQIFGFPLSFAWVIGMLICSFTALFVFFKADTEEEK